MEILNNVWAALSTPNERLMEFLTVPPFFIEIPLIMYMFIYALNISATKKQKVEYIVLSIITGIICKFIIPSPYNVVLNYGVSLVLIHLIFKLKLLKSFIAMIIPAIVFVLIGVLISNPFLTVLHIDYRQAETVPVYRYLYLTISYLLLFIVDLSLKNKNIALTIIDELDKKNKLIIFANLIIGLIAIISQIII